MIDRSKIPYPDKWPQEERNKLDRLFEEAVKDNKWFFHNSLLGTFWYSPEELHELQMTHEFLFSAENWKLVDPDEYVTYLTNEIDNTFKTLIRLTETQQDVIQWMNSHRTKR